MAIFDDVLDESDLADLASPPRPWVFDLAKLQVAVACGRSSVVERIAADSEAVLAEIAAPCAPDAAWPVGATPPSGKHGQWALLCREALALARAITTGSYIEALSLSLTAKALLRGPSASEEAHGECAPSDRATLASVLAKRIADVVVSGERASCEGEDADLESGGVRLAREAACGDYDGADLGPGGEAAATPTALRACCVQWVGAALLQLWQQANFTGPEPSPTALGAVYPPALLLPWLQRSAPKEAAAGLAGVQPSVQELKRVRMLREQIRVGGAGESAAKHAQDAAAKLTETAPDADAEAKAEAPEAGAKGTTTAGEVDDGALIDEGLALPAFHKACLDGLAVAGSDAYRRQSLPALLLLAGALFDGLTGVATDDSNVCELLTARGITSDDAEFRMALLGAKAAEGAASLADDTPGSAAPSGASTLRAAYSSSLVREAWSVVQTQAPGALWWSARTSLAHALSLQGSSSEAYSAANTSKSGSAGRAATTQTPAVLVERARRAFVAATVNLLPTPALERLPNGVWSLRDVFRSSLVGAELAGSGAAAHAAERHGLVSTAAAAGAASGERWSGCDWADRKLVGRLLLEWGLALHHFDRRAAAKTAFFLAKGALGLRTLLTGALGRRKKHQSWDAPLLVLRARSDAPMDSEDGSEKEQAAASGGEKEQAAASGGEKEQAAASGGEKEQAAASGGEKEQAAASGGEKEQAAASGGDTALASSDAAATGAASGDGSSDGKVLSDLTAELGVTVRSGRFGVGEILLEDLDPDQNRMEEPSMTVLPEGVTATSEEGMRRRTTHWKDAFQSHDEWADKFGSGIGRKFDEHGKEIKAPRHVPTPEELAEEEAQAAAVAAAEIEDGPLDTVQQGALLALCLDVENSSPRDGLTRAEMRPYLRRVMAMPQNWLVHSSALLGRCDLEFADHKVMDRAVLQMQVLVDQHSERLTPLLSRRADTGTGKSALAADSTTAASAEDPEAAGTVEKRLRWLTCLPWPSRWGLKRQLADRYISMGVAASAAAVYEELGLWGDVVDCYVIMDKPTRARKLLDRLLRVDPTPRLWCVRGAVADQDAPYARAWEESGRKFAPAMLSLGKRFFDREAWAEAIAAMQEGLRVSPDNSLEWAVVGASAMRLHDYVVARQEHADKQTVYLDALEGADDAAGSGSSPPDAPEAPGPAPVLVRVDDAPMQLRRASAALLAKTPRQILELAARGFTESVRCDEGRGDAWANLGAILGRLERWRAAVVAMERGLKTDLGRRNWRAWDNMATAAVRCGEYSKVLLAMQGVLSLQKQGGDRSCPPFLERPLAALTAVVVESLLREGTPADAATTALPDMAERAALAAITETDEDEEEPEPEEHDHEIGDPVPPIAPVAPVDDDLIDAAATAGLLDEEDATESDDAASRSRPQGVPATGYSGMSPPESGLHDSLGRAARGYAKMLSRFMEQASRQSSGSALFWRLCAALSRARGRPDEALQAKLKECRALNRSEWQRGSEPGRRTLKYLVRACGELLQDFLGQPAPAPEPAQAALLGVAAAGEGTSDSLPAATTATLGSSSARGGRQNAALFLEGVIRRAESGKVLGDDPLVHRLRALLAAVKAGSSAEAVLGAE